MNCTLCGKELRITDKIAHNIQEQRSMYYNVESMRMFSKPMYVIAECTCGEKFRVPNPSLEGTEYNPS